MDCRPLCRVLVIVGAAAGSAFLQAPALAQANLLRDLGTVAGIGINNAGQVALSSGIYNNGVVTPLGILPGDTSNVVPNAINASGQVAGNTNLPMAPTLEIAVFYDNGTLTSFGASASALDQSFATGINSSGQIVGWLTVLGDTNSDAFVYSNGVLTNIGRLPGSPSLNGGEVDSEANAINDKGQITGAALNTGAVTEGYDAFIYYNGTWTDIGPGEGFAINALGQVTGVLGQTRADNVVIPNSPVSGLNTPLVGHAFIYSSGTLTDLGTLPGGTTAAGYAINSTGQIVGASDGAGISGQHAFFYNGALIDMNALVSATDPLQPFVMLTEARGINDSRMIVVNGIDSRTQLQHAYLLQGPWLDVAPGSLSFPSQAIGTVSSAQPVSLTNSGPTTLAVGAISTSGDFRQTNNCGASLASSSSCTVMVSFAPTAAGDLTSSLTIVSTGVPIAIPLSGTAPVQITISSSSATTTARMPVTLTWTASPDASCVATGGSAADGWTGNLNVSGTQPVTESAAATYHYGLTCTAGSQSASAQVSVVVTWPAVSVSISAMPVSITAGQSTTLTWQSSNADTCVATGGGAGDNWPGSKPTSGSAKAPESYVPASPSLILTFTLKCTSTVSGLSASANTVVTEDAPPPAKSGGGALDIWSAIFLIGVAVLRVRDAWRRG
jgi:probable HAF family extracellular repeat protein